MNKLFLTLHLTLMVWSSHAVRFARFNPRRTRQNNGREGAVLRLNGWNGDAAKRPRLSGHWRRQFSLNLTTHSQSQAKSLKRFAGSWATTLICFCGRFLAIEPKSSPLCFAEN